MRHSILAIVIMLTLAAPAVAQSRSDNFIADIQDAYRQFEYELAERMGREALHRYSDFTVEQLTDVHTVLGLVAYNRGDQSESRRQFVSALQLTPDLTLDPLLISPKIVDFFDEIKDDISARDAGSDEASVRYVLLPDRRSDAALRSMIAPGWGQFYKGHTTKGWVFSSAFGAAAAAAVGAHLKRQSAEEVYLDERNPNLVESRYDTMNRWHKARSGFVQAAAAIWAIGYIDALLTRPEIDTSKARIAVGASPRSVSLAVRF